MGQSIKSNSKSIHAKKRPDLRVDHRYAVREAKVGFAKAIPLMPLILEPKEMSWPMVDISVHGMQFACKTALKRGSKHEISIHCPAFKDPLIARAEVRWTRKDPKRKGVYRVGLEFKKLKASSKDNIDKLTRDSMLRQHREGQLAVW